MRLPPKGPCIKKVLPASLFRALLRDARYKSSSSPTVSAAHVSCTQWGWSIGDLSKCNGIRRPPQELLPQELHLLSSLMRPSVRLWDVDIFGKQILNKRGPIQKRKFQKANQNRTKDRVNTDPTKKLRRQHGRFRKTKVNSDTR